MYVWLTCILAWDQSVAEWYSYNREAAARLAELIRDGAATLEQVRNHREQEGGSLTRASLSAGHEVAVTHGNGKAVLLDRGGGLVAGEGNVGHEVGVELGLLKLVYRTGKVRKIKSARQKSIPR